MDTIIQTIGLAITAIGAGIAAKGVAVSDQKAGKIAATKWGENAEHKASLLLQSATARRGLRWVVVGTVVQIVATAAPLFKSLWP